METYINNENITTKYEYKNNYFDNITNDNIVSNEEDNLDI